MIYPISIHHARSGSYNLDPAQLLQRQASDDGMDSLVFIYFR